MKILCVILGAVMTSGIGQLFLSAGAKSSMLMTFQALWEPSTWCALVFHPKVLLGLFFWGISTMLWLIVLNSTELSYAYCLGSLNYVVIPVVSQWLFKERIEHIRIIGMLIIFIGVLVTLYGRYVEHVGH